MSTEEDRAALERIVGEPIWNARNYPEPAQVHIMGRNISKLRTAVVDALLAAGVRVRAVDPNADERKAILRVLHKHSTRDAEIAADSILSVLRAAGFGDVAAERARAEALQVRIDAAPHDPRQCDLIHYPDRRRKGTATCTCWKSTVDQPAPVVEHHYEDGSYDFDIPPTPEPPHLDPEPWMGPTGERFPDENHQSDIAKRDGYFARWFAPRPADENGKPYSQDRADYEGRSK